MDPADSARQKLLGEFRQCTLERVERINLDWISLERDPHHKPKAEELLRELHSLKGEAKIMGYADVSLVAHRTEELVIFAVERFLDVPDAVGDLILAATDTISAIVRKKAGTAQGTIDLSALMERFDRVMERFDRVMERDGKERGRTAPTSKEQSRESGWEHAEQGPEASRVIPERSVRMDLDRVGELAESASEIVVAHGKYQHSVRALQDLVEVALGSLTEIESEQARRPALAAIGRSVAVLATGGDLSATAGLRGVLERIGSVAKDVEQQVYEGSVIARDLEQRSRELRLVPVRGVLDRYVRAVRDLAREHGKQIAVEIEDEGIRIDKNVVEKLVEPLLHLIRNCVDHGIEPVDERRRAGKPEKALVKLSAKRQGASVLVTVTDDGRGIDTGCVRGRAVELGLISRDASGSLDDEACLGYLFSPGFSTRAVATETSGRGLGLDVVKRNVELLGGSVVAHSLTGRGTSFELRVPGSISLMRVLVVRCHEALYAFPSRAVEAVVAIADSDVEKVNGRSAIRHGGHVVPLVDLAGFVETDAPETDIARALIVRHENARGAFLVSEWTRETEVVVKTHRVLDATRIFAGGCNLYDGKLVLVFNPPELLQRAREKAPRLAVVTGETEAEHPLLTRIMLVEDQAITRAMIARVLRTLGHQVLEAADGGQALGVLENEPVHLLVTDLDMPGMGGIELIRHLRARPEWSNLPIVVLSTHGSDEDKREALEAGADEYLVKTEFSEKVLGNTIRRRLGR